MHVSYSKIPRVFCYRRWSCSSGAWPYAEAKSNKLSSGNLCSPYISAVAQLQTTLTYDNLADFFQKSSSKFPLFPWDIFCRMVLFQTELPIWNNKGIIILLMYRKRSRGAHLASTYELLLGSDGFFDPSGSSNFIEWWRPLTVGRIALWDRPETTQASHKCMCVLYIFGARRIPIQPFSPIDVA